jgi:hypothetical protein
MEIVEYSFTALLSDFKEELRNFHFRLGTGCEFFVKFLLSFGSTQFIEVWVELEREKK